MRQIVRHKPPVFQRPLTLTDASESTLLLLSCDSCVCFLLNRLNTRVRERERFRVLVTVWSSTECSESDGIGGIGGMGGKGILSAAEASFGVVLDDGVRDPLEDFREGTKGSNFAVPLRLRGSGLLLLLLFDLDDDTHLVFAMSSRATGKTGTRG